MNEVNAKLVIKLAADQGLYVPHIKMDKLIEGAPASAHAEHLTAALLEHTVRALESIGVTIKLCYAQDIYSTPREE